MNPDVMIEHGPGSVVYDATFLYLTGEAEAMPVFASDEELQAAFSAATDFVRADENPANTAQERLGLLQLVFDAADAAHTFPAAPSATDEVSVTINKGGERRDGNYNQASGNGWMNDKNCKNEDPNVFFPSTRAGIKKAKAICDECVVIEPCLEYALQNNLDDGFMGGLTANQRKQLRQQRRSAQ